MIERFFVEIDDNGVATLVLEVTDCALASFVRWQATVEPFPRRNIASDFRVAIVTERGLILLGQGGMACIAVGLDTGVTFHHGPRHDQPLLDVGRACRRRAKCQEAQQSDRDR